MRRYRMNILSIATAIQSNKRTESVSCVLVSRIEPRLCDALLSFPSDGLLVTKLLTCSDAHKLRKDEL